MSSKKRIRPRPGVGGRVVPTRQFHNVRLPPTSWPRIGEVGLFSMKVAGESEAGYSIFSPRMRDRRLVHSLSLNREKLMAAGIGAWSVLQFQRWRTYSCRMVTSE